MNGHEKINETPKTYPLIAVKCDRCGQESKLATSPGRPPLPCLWRECDGELREVGK